MLEGFSEYHPTGVRIITDKETGNSKGFGYVEFWIFDYI
jgi:RNA recognition motif-containing protein